MTDPALAALGLYAGLNAFILFWLMTATGRVRLREKVAMGDGGNPALIRVMRGHANAIEIIPIALILMLVLALIGQAPAVIHAFGIVLTVGRLAHATHFTATSAPRWQRGLGALSSALVLLGGGLLAVLDGLARLM